jgi:glycosyltransferase involved in cell wall biosynthesis
MKILMILEHTYPPDERVENEISQLILQNHEITLVCYNSVLKYEVERLKNLTIVRIPISNLMLKFGALALLVPLYFKFWNKHLYKVLKENNINAIHLHDLPLIKVAFILSKKFDIPLVADYHENRPEIMKFYHHTNTFFGRLLISKRKWNTYQLNYTPKVEKLILVTEEAKDFYIEHYHIASHKITVLPNYVDLDRLETYKKDSILKPSIKDKFTLVYFGDTGIRRGTMTILDSAYELESYYDLCFLIIGSSKEQKILESIVINRHQKNVILTGWVSIDEALNYIKISKVGLCPFIKNIHHDTTYANKMFQYMAFHKPVIVSNCLAQSHLVNNEQVGLVFQSGNSADLSKKILEIKDGFLYNKLSINAYESVSNKFNWAVSGKKLISLYENL